MPVLAQVKTLVLPDFESPGVELYSDYSETNYGSNIGIDIIKANRVVLTVITSILNLEVNGNSITVKPGGYRIRNTGTEIKLTRYNNNVYYELSSLCCDKSTVFQYKLSPDYIISCYK